MKRFTPIVASLAAWVAAVAVHQSATHAEPSEAQALDRQLAGVLKSHAFTGRMQQQLEQRLGRKVDPDRANLGRFLWFDRLIGIRGDNTCAGCHSPVHGFGDSQPMAIGIDNNNIVGPHRKGPRNMRRTPMVLNTAFYPKLMWNSRFVALSEDPFNNSDGFQFPAPEGLSLSNQPHLLVAQAFIPPTERNEMAGFEFEGDNDDIRAEVIDRLNDTPNYRDLFRKAYPEIGEDDPITYDHFAAAIAEFEFALTFANAPIDQFARGSRDAMTSAEKRGALLFFGKAGCIACHSVAEDSNEMFSDFTPHVLGVPQVAPRLTNSTFDGLGANEDFGLEQITGNRKDRYKFRTSPLRNIALQPAFFHNGAFSTLEDAIAHHLNVSASVKNYSPEGRLPEDLAGPLGPMAPVLARLDPRIRRSIRLTRGEFSDLVTFVRTGLLDPRATPRSFASLIPDRLPSELQPLEFETDD
jgi:cytochrome c peroxidase